MVEIKLVFLLIFCILSSAAFLLAVIASDGKTEENFPCIIIPVTRETENMELIARDIVLRAAEHYGSVSVILLDNGADSEQLAVFEKIAGNIAYHQIVKL